MRVGINCLNIDPNYAGGVTSYTFGLLDGWVRTTTDIEFVILANSGNVEQYRQYTEHPNFSIEVIDFEIAGWQNKLIWQAVKLQSKALYGMLHKQFYKPLADRIDKLVDVVYCPNTILYPLYLKSTTVLSMHDIQQVHFPEFFEQVQLKDRYITYNISAEQLNYLQATSEHMKDDFLGYFKTLKAKQVVKIPEGVDIPLFRDQGDVEYLKEKYDLPDQFLYFPAQLWHHKNHITVLKALKKLRDEQGITIPLVLTGSRYSASQHLFDYIEEHQLNNVFYLGKIPFPDVVALYKKARFLITAVLYESSSIPVLEAAAAGTPVIASDTRPNRELGERLQVNLFEPKDVDALIETLQRVWTDDDLIARQVVHNQEAIQYYSWDNAAKMYADLFRKISK